MKLILKLDQAIYPIWENFRLELSQTIELYAGKIYHLQGSNGSGKSSFIRKCLIPALKTKGIPYIYLEQQMRAQIFALMADAALSEYKSPLQTEADAIEYLLFKAEQNRAVNSLALVCICDESAYSQRVYQVLSEKGWDFAMLIVAHDHPDFEEVTEWQTKLLHPMLSSLSPR